MNSQNLSPNRKCLSECRPSTGPPPRRRRRGCRWWRRCRPAWRSCRCNRWPRGGRTRAPWSCIYGRMLSIQSVACFISPYAYWEQRWAQLPKVPHFEILKFRWGSTSSTQKASVWLLNQNSGRRPFGLACPGMFIDTYQSLSIFTGFQVEEVDPNGTSEPQKKEPWLTGPLSGLTLSKDGHTWALQSKRPLAS